MRRFIFGLVLGVGVLIGARAEAQGVTFPTNIVRVSGAVMEARVMTKVDPVYPPEAREKGIAGTVVMGAIIGADGVVQDLRMISGPPMLRAAAMDAVRQWTYQAYVLNGNTVPVNTTVTVKFSLTDMP
jgi:protein TonB